MQKRKYPIECCCLIAAHLFYFSSAAQVADSSAENDVQFNRMERSAIFFPVANSTYTISGSPWFSPVWLPGQVAFTDGHSLPLPGEIIYLNYDKAKNRLFCKKGDSVIAFRESTVEDFRLDDSTGIHSFAKVPRLSSSAYLEVLVEPGNGFSLYRKLISRLRAPDYLNVGYTTTGHQSARYTDEILYFLVYPDGKKYRRFSLTHAGLRKELSRINPKAKHYIASHPGPVDYELLRSLCDELNESGPPVQSGLPAKSHVPTEE